MSWRYSGRGWRLSLTVCPDRCGVCHSSEKNTAVLDQTGNENRCTSRFVTLAELIDELERIPRIILIRFHNSQSESKEKKGAYGSLMFVHDLGLLRLFLIAPSTAFVIMEFASAFEIVFLAFSMLRVCGYIATGFLLSLHRG